MTKRFMGLTEAQENALSLIAIGQQPFSSPKTLQVLVDKGLITKGERAVYGKGNSPIDRIPIMIPSYEVPMHIHIQWCEWCAKIYSEDV